jgi:sulfoxide reductase heme-binding subunit YedZ
MTDALWYLGRGTGVVSLVLLTLVLTLGIVTRSGRPLPGLPRFAVTALHRSTSLLAVVFVAVHVLTLLFDPYAQLDLVSLVVPFTAGADPFWYGLGAVALDLLLALVMTSLLRRHIGPRVWRGLHWTAYACWPIALAHGLGAGTDAATGWMLTTVGVCMATLLGAVGRRWSERFSEVSEPRPVPVLPAPRIGV